MSRTWKDVPYWVKARRRGYRTGEERQEYTRVERVVEVFYAHETREREAFEAACREASYDVSEEETTGWLGVLPQDPMSPVATAREPRRYLWNRPPVYDAEILEDLGISRPATPKMNIFVVVTATRSTTKVIEPQEYRLHSYQAGAWRCNCTWCTKEPESSAVVRAMLRHELNDALAEDTDDQPKHGNGY